MIDSTRTGPQEWNVEFWCRNGFSAAVQNSGHIGWLLPEVQYYTWSRQLSLMDLYQQQLRHSRRALDDFAVQTKTRTGISSCQDSVHCLFPITPTALIYQQRPRDACVAPNGQDINTPTTHKTSICDSLSTLGSNRATMSFAGNACCVVICNNIPKL